MRDENPFAQPCFSSTDRGARRFKTRATAPASLADALSPFDGEVGLASRGGGDIPLLCDHDVDPAVRCSTAGPAMSASVHAF